MRTFRLPKLVLIVGTIFTQVSYADTIEVSASEYGDNWSFNVSKIELECINMAVLAHTERGTFALNGKAQSRYKGKYPSIREISKPYPGMEDNPNAKRQPPTGLIQKGLTLCQ